MSSVRIVFISVCHWRSPPKPIFGQWKAMNIYIVQLNSEFPERRHFPSQSTKVRMMFNLDGQLQSLFKNHALDAQHAKGVCLGPKPDTQAANRGVVTCPKRVSPFFPHSSHTSGV